MSITTHPGFHEAMAESWLTASQVSQLSAYVEALEGYRAGSSQRPEDAYQARKPELPSQEKYPTPPGPSLPSQAACAHLQTPHEPSENSSSHPSHFDMTATEIMARSGVGVES